MDEGLRDEILRRRQADQDARASAVDLMRSQTPGEPPSEEARQAMSRMKAVDEANTSWLRDLVRERGWPKRSEVGDEAASAAWLLVQHSDLDPAFQRECLGLLEEAVQAGEASPRDLAYLTDRVLRAEGKPQRYGTQFAQGPDGRLEPQELEDPERVDERRASVGLGRLEEYARRMRQAYGPRQA